MANYECSSRTNYFNVVNSGRLKDLVDRLPSAELWEAADGTFAFGGYDSITHYYDEDSDEYKEIIPELQEILPEGEVIIILETGNEKLRYVIGHATVITKDKCETLDLSELAIKKAQEMLGDDKKISISY